MLKNLQKRRTNGLRGFTSKLRGRENVGSKAASGMPGDSRSIESAKQVEALDPVVQFCTQSGFDRILCSKVIRKFKKHGMATVPELKEIIKRNAGVQDAGCLECTILNALPEKTRLRCYRDLYMSHIVRNELFRGLCRAVPKEEVEAFSDRLVQSFERENLGPGRYLAVSPRGALYIVRRGELEVFQKGVLVARMRAGSVFEICAFADRFASVHQSVANADGDLSQQRTGAAFRRVQQLRRDSVGSEPNDFRLDGGEGSEFEDDDESELWSSDEEQEEANHDGEGSIEQSSSVGNSNFGAFEDSRGSECPSPRPAYSTGGRAHARSTSSGDSGSARHLSCELPSLAQRPSSILGSLPLQGRLSGLGKMLTFRRHSDQLPDFSSASPGTPEPRPREVTGSPRPRGSSLAIQSEKDLKIFSWVTLSIRAVETSEAELDSAALTGRYGFGAELGVLSSDNLRALVADFPGVHRNLEVLCVSVEMQIEREAEAAKRRQEALRKKSEAERRAALNSELERACIDGSLTRVEEAIAAGAGVNERLDASGASALHLAAVLGHVEIVSLLIRLGSDGRLGDKDGRTPLHHCCLVPLWNPLVISKLVNLLAQNESWLFAQDKWGNTPLHLAATTGNATLVNLLKDHVDRGSSSSGALLTILNNDGQMALDVCATLDCKRVLKPKTNTTANVR